MSNVVQFKQVLPAFDLFGHLAKRERLKCPQLMALQQFAIANDVAEPEIDPVEKFKDDAIAFFIELEEKQLAAKAMNARRTRRRRRRRGGYAPTATIHFALAPM